MKGTEMKQGEEIDMTLEELREYIRQMPDGVSLIITVEGTCHGTDTIRS